MPVPDSFGARSTLRAAWGDYVIHRLAALERAGLGTMGRLPYSIRVLLESVLRNVDGFSVLDEHVRALAGWTPASSGSQEIPFKCARVVLQDFTGVPCVVDLAAMRGAMVRLGRDPKRINPQIPVDLVIDHSVQVDHYASAGALDLNARLEFERNRERYEFLRWGQRAFDNFRVVPPATGIVHQVNLEYLAKVVLQREVNGEVHAIPDTLVGTDSHTTMINGLGVLGWGVGGIEAEAAMLGQPMYMLMPQVVGLRLTGALPEGATATDLVLRVTEILRAHGVVDKFVEFFGPGLSNMRLADRATIGNMAPEYGATVGFFPVDSQTLDYLRFTGRSPDEVDLVERYCKEQGLFRTDASPDPAYTEVLTLDLGGIEPSLAGPRRPQDRIALSAMKAQWRADLSTVFGKAARDATSTVDSFVGEGGQAAVTAVRSCTDAGGDGTTVELNGRRFVLDHGAVVIAAITSCTNTSNPSVMLAAGLVAQAAVERGLEVKPWVKTSLAPGSRVVTDYLEKSGLNRALDQLGFQTVGYGCTTCIGNSGPLPEAIARAVQSGDLVVSAVLSGNRNFEARIHPLIRANYLASPPLVVAYALAGTTDIDLTRDPLGTDRDGQLVYLKDIWPTQRQIDDAVRRFVTPEMFKQRYADVFTGPPEWRRLGTSEGDVYAWRADSTYIQEPPFFVGLTPRPAPIAPLRGARCLVMVGDSVTTDHISPAGSIKPDSPAGRYLQERGVKPADFNSYGSRRGNDRVMTRGTFANVRIRNLLAPGTEGGVTLYLGKGGAAPAPQQMPVYDAAMKYRDEGVPLIVLAGKDYGMGSSRDWAAKGALLLGVRAVIAVSFERIHRTNLVCMGVLPCVFKRGQTRESLGLTGREVFDFVDLGDDLRPQQELRVVATDPGGRKVEFAVDCRVDTPVEVEYYRNGGVLQTVLRKLSQ
ncbi:MAG: aconitate hydratase AcnA [Phycisphaerae bacterium]|nr:aconitate hydratase AcnA [Phycisphaerae bacterium]MCZ2398897.1 aconitate hydratase AcnA [Phycisphaerae bacterium]NUQ49675.1 aconitate hydratase AcnA [Phycisphaerae bacterium]